MRDLSGAYTKACPLRDPSSHSPYVFAKGSSAIRHTPVMADPSDGKDLHRRWSETGQDLTGALISSLTFYEKRGK